MYNSIDEIRRANERLGRTWFSDGNMRFFGSKIESAVYPLTNCAFFITSEQDPEGQAWLGNRRYTIRVADQEGEIWTVGEFGQYFNLNEARLAIMDKIRNEG